MGKAKHKKQAGEKTLPRSIRGKARTPKERIAELEEALETASSAVSLEAHRQKQVLQAISDDVEDALLGIREPKTRWHILLRAALSEERRVKKGKKEERQMVIVRDEEGRVARIRLLGSSCGRTEAEDSDPGERGE